MAQIASLHKQGNAFENCSQNSCNRELNASLNKDWPGFFCAEKDQIHDSVAGKLADIFAFRCENYTEKITGSHFNQESDRF